MSLAAFALRTCAVRALRGRTLAGATAVYDSPVDMADLAEKATTPSIFVFSDLERLTSLATRDVLDGDNTVDLAMMIVLPAEFQATVGGATVTFDDRRAGAAAAIDLIYRQVERALLDESSVWSGLWVRFVFKLVEVEAHAYVLPVGKGPVLRKLPARAIRIVIQPLQEPGFGVEPEGIWAEFVTAMAGDAGLAPLAPLFAAAIQGDALPEWRVDALELGDTVADAIELGYGPLGGGAGDDVVTMGLATIDVGSPDASPVTFTVVEGQPESFEP
ncbi:MAG: hypothetical protein ACRYGP_13850 [Janthinobacterium lividum]